MAKDKSDEGHKSEKESIRPIDLCPRCKKGKMEIDGGDNLLFDTKCNRCGHESVT